MTDPTKAQGADVTETVWQADVRSPSPTSSVEDQEGCDRSDGETELNVNGKRGNKDRLWFELDLSSREDHAKVEHNPFTIARKNKRAKQEQVPVKTGVANPQGNYAEKASRITVTTKDRDRQSVPEPTSSASRDRSVLGSTNTMAPQPSPRKLVNSKPLSHAKSADSHDKPQGLSKTSATSKQNAQPNQNKKATAINSKPSPIRFGRLRKYFSRGGILASCADSNSTVNFHVPLAKISEGHSPDFPILQGLKRQEQIAQEQQKEHERKEQLAQEQQRHQRGRNALTEMASEARAIDVTSMQQANPRANPPRLSAAGASVANDDFVSAGYDHGHAVQVNSPQIDIQYAFYPDSTQTYVTTTDDRWEDDSGGLSLGSQVTDPFQRPYYHRDSDFGEETFIAQGNTHAGRSTRLPLAHGSLPPSEYHPVTRNALPSRNSRVSLPSTRLSQTATQSSHSRDLYSRMPRESSASIGRNGNASRFFGPQARTNQAANRPSYSEGRDGANTRTQIHGASRTTDIETSPLGYSASGDSEWSTLPGKKSSHTLKATGVDTKAFRLPGKLFGTPGRAIKADPGEPSQRSADSATEVGLPLRRKLTLFQPTPPKPGDSAF